MFLKYFVLILFFHPLHLNAFHRALDCTNAAALAVIVIDVRHGFWVAHYPFRAHVLADAALDALLCGDNRHERLPLTGNHLRGCAGF